MFSSPAANHLERTCDLNDLVAPNRDAVFYIEVECDSAEEDNVFKGDVLVIDRYMKPDDDSLVLVWAEGEHHIKRIQFVDDLIILIPHNDGCDPIFIHVGENYRFFGVVTHIAKNILRHVRAC